MLTVPPFPTVQERAASLRMDLKSLSRKLLLRLGDDCSDPLAPEALVNLAATCHQMLKTLQPKLIKLREFRIGVRELCSKAPYQTTFSTLAEAFELSWNDRSLSLSNLAILGQLLQKGALPNLLELDLSHRCNSKIEDQGFAALVEDLSPRSLPALQALYLSFNAIGNKGTRSLSSSLAKGAMANLKHLVLNSNLISDAGMASLSGAIAEGALRKLETLDIDGNMFGDEGVKSFSAAIGVQFTLPSLRELDLDRNHITDEGMSVLAKAIAWDPFRAFGLKPPQPALPALEKLRVEGNIGTSALVEDVCAHRRFQSISRVAASRPMRMGMRGLPYCV